MRFGRLLFVMALLLALTGCQNGGAAGSDTAGVFPDDNTSWRLRSGLDVKLPAAAEVTLEIGAGHSVSGNSSCNRFSGRMQLDGGKVSISPLAATKRGCVGLRGEIEKQYLAALAKVDALSVKDGQLTAHLSDGGELIFEASSDSDVK